MVMPFLVMAVAAERRQAMSELKMGDNFSIRKWSQQKLFRELLCICANDNLIQKNQQKEEEEEFHDLLLGSTERERQTDRQTDRRSRAG